MTESNNIPKHWEIKHLEEITSVLGDGLHGTPKYSETGEYYFINGNNLTDGKIEIKANTKRVTFEEFEKYKKPLNERTIFVSINGTLGYTAFYRDEKVILGKSACYFNVLNTIDKNYIRYYLTTSSFTNYANKNATGSTIKNVGLKTIRELPIPIPPTIEEQQAIVAKIEELFSELDNGIAQLKTAQQQLKVYRQSLLKWAFVKGSFKENILKDVTEKIQIGPFGTQLHKHDYIENGIPLINPMHIQDGKIIPNFSYSISKAKKESLPNYILNEGDVIMGRRGEMGRCGLVSKKETGWFCGTGSLYFRPNKNKLNSLFLFYYLTSQPVKKYLDINAGGTTMANLNLKIVNEIPINLPSLNEQQLIVDELESKLTVCDKIEETISQNLQQAETLRQSILKKAFEGKLIKMKQ